MPTISFDDFKKIAEQPAQHPPSTPPPRPTVPIKSQSAQKGVIPFDQFRQIAQQKPQGSGTKDAWKKFPEAPGYKSPKEWLFGKASTPVTPEEQRTGVIRSNDTGALGKLWNDVMDLPVAPGKNLRTLGEQVFNPLGRTDLQQERAESLRDIEDARASQGRGVLARSALSAGRGVGDVIEGQTSPFNLALLFSGMIKGPTPEAATDITKAPTRAAQVAQTLGKLSHFYWTAQMATGAVDAATSSVDAFRRGDYQTGVRMAVGGLVSGLMAHSSFDEMHATEKIESQLNTEAKSKHGKSWIALNPSQRADVLYAVANKQPFWKEQTPESAAEYEKYSAHAMQMAPPPGISPQTNEILERHQDGQETRQLSNQVLAKDLYKNRVQALDAEQQRKDATQIESDRAQARQAQTEYEAKLKETLPPQPKMSAEQRAFARQAEREKQAMQEYQEEQHRKEIEAKNATQLISAMQEEPPQLTPIQDRRANAEHREALLKEITEGRAARTREADLYKEHSDQLELLSDQIMPRRSPGVVHESLKVKMRDHALSPEEESFMRQWNRREEIQRLLFARDSDLKAKVTPLLDRIDQEAVRNIMDLSSRERSQREAAATFRNLAVKSNDIDAIDRLMGQSFEMEEAAERTRAERQREQVTRTAAEESTKTIPARPPLNITMGEKGTVRLVGTNNLVPIHYGAVRLSQLVLSHDPFSFEWNGKYEPQKMQPRDLSKNREAQAAAITDSKPENYDPTLYLSDDPTGQQGPAVILKDGRVAGGNSRLIRLTRALQTERRPEIIHALSEALHKFGIDMPDLVDDQDPYIPVRILDSTPEDAETLIRLGADLNRDLMLALSEEETAVKEGQRLNQDDIGDIAAWMEQLPDDATLATLMTARGSQILDLMQNRGIIPENKRAQYVTRDGELTTDAKSLFSRLIMGKVIDDADLLATAPPEQMQKLERAMLPLVQIQAANEQWHIGDYLKEALRVWKEIAPIRAELDKIGTANDSLVDKLERPQNFKGGIASLTPRPELHPVTEALAKLLEKPTKEVRDSLSRYGSEAEGRQASLMGERDPLESFNLSIGKKVDVKVSPTDWGTEQPATREQKAEDEAAQKPLPKPSKRERLQDPTAMAPLPGVKEESQAAAQELLSAIDDGTVTPDSLKKLFKSDTKTRPYADALMKVMGEWIPRATGQSLPDFLKDHIAKVERLNQSDAEPLKWHKAIEPPPSWTSVATGAPDSPINGVTRFLDDGRVLIQLFEGHEPTTVLHEFFHAVRRFVNDQDQAILTRHFAPDGIWTRDGEELAARTWEKYFAEGKAPTEEMKTVFAKLKEVFRKVYFMLVGKSYKLKDEAGLRHHATGKPIQIKPEVRAVFDRWLGAEIEPPPAEIQPLRDAETAGLAEWIGKSKVVDDAGKPLVMHHQTWNEIRGDFDRQWAAKKFGRDLEDLDTIGTWFSDHPDLGKYGPRNVDAYLRIENPLVLEDGPGGREYSAFKKLHRQAKAEGGSTALRNRLKKEGYDGILFKNSWIDVDKANTWVAFEPDQIKVVSQSIIHPEKVRQNEEIRAKNEAARAAKAAPRELVPPPESVETAITPEEREKATLIANGNPENSLLSRMGDVRAKRFESFEAARDWAIRNKDNLWALQLWQTPSGGVFAEFVPNDAGKPLYQAAPLTFKQAIDRIDELEKRAKAVPDAMMRGSMLNEVRMLRQRYGIPEESSLSAFPSAPEGQNSLFAPPPAPSGGIIIPSGDLRPDLRPVAKSDQAPTLFAGTGEKYDVSKAERPGRVPDAGAGLRQPPKDGGVDEPSSRPAGAAPSSRPLSGRPPVEGVRGRSGRDRGADLSHVAPARVAPPQRMRGPATVSDAQWRVRLAELKMPQALPAPTVRLHGNIAAQLIFAGQVEVAESTASALQQFDGTIIGTPGGTGKTFTALAVVKQRIMSGESRRVIIAVPSENIARQKDGWIHAGKNKFGLEVKEVPKNLKDLPEGVYYTTYAKLRTRANISSFPWDLMVADEAHAARRWWESEQGPRIRALSDTSAKAIYVSATPFYSAAEVGYLTKLGLWDKGDFDNWAKQFGARRSSSGAGWSREGNEPSRLLKLREQLVGRGQFVTQEESYEGYTSDMAVVPVTEEVKQNIANIQQAFRLAEGFYNVRGNLQRARTSRALAVTYLKAYLERKRLPELMQMVRQSIKQGWHPLIFSDTVSSREDIYDYLQDADRGMQGEIDRLLPPLEDIYQTLAKEFGQENIANFSGPASAKREEDKNAFNRGDKRIMFLTYAAGSEGMNAHDTSKNGERPRMAFYLGPPYNGFKFEQSLKRPWRFGAKSDVHAVFLASNARPELRMLYTKIAPRLEALRAVVQGVDADHRVIRAMKGLSSWHDGQAQFELGSGEKVEAGDFEMETADQVPIQNWKNVRLPDAERAKGKGMKYPGMSDDKPGVISLFQKGEMVVPARFLSQEEAEAQLKNEEFMQALTDGESVPVLGDRVSEIDPGARRVLADAHGPLVTERIQNHGSLEPTATSREALHTSFTQILADQEANRIAAKMDEGEGNPPNWEYETGATPPPPSEDEGRADFNYHAFLLSGRENIASIERQFGKNLNIRRDLEMYQTRQFTIMGEYQQRFLDILKTNKISDKEFRAVWMVKEGKMPAPNERIARAAQDLTHMLNEIREEGGKRGLYVKVMDEEGREQRYLWEDMENDPHYMPHKHDFKEKITLKDPDTGEEQVFTLAQLLDKKSMSDVKRDQIISSIEKNTGWSRLNIEKWLDQSRRRTRVAGSIERSRSADFPFYRMDHGVMLEYFHEFGEASARAEIFGQDQEKLDGKIAQIPNAKAQKVVKEIVKPLLEPRAMSKSITRIYSPLATASVIGKMTFSTVKVPFHAALSMPLILGELTPVMKGIVKTAFSPREAWDFALYSGALARNVLAESALDRTNEMKLASRWLSAQGFNFAVKQTRVIAAFTARNYMENALPKLIRNAKSAPRLREVLREKMLLSDNQIDTAMKRGQWSKDDLSHGAVALVNRGLFTDDPTEMPPMSRRQGEDELGQSLDAALRLASVLHSYTFKVGMLIKRDVIGELKKGNWWPIILLSLAEPLVGEAVRAASAGSRSIVAGAARIIPGMAAHPGAKTPWQKYQDDLEDIFHDPTVAKFVHRWIDDVGANTGWTIISHVFDVLVFSPKDRRLAKFEFENLAGDLTSEIVGVNATDLYHSVSTLSQMIGDARLESGQELYTDEKHLAQRFARQVSPALRSIVPPPSRGTSYDIAPPPQ